MVKASETVGVKPMPIEGRLARERERLLGMTDAERNFRAQWLKSQILTEREPVAVPQRYTEMYNPIRRFYRYPLDRLEQMIAPIVGRPKSLYIRYFAGKGLMTIAFAYYMTYYLKYNANDWTRTGGVYVIQSRKSVVPGDPDYPKLPDRHEGRDYADRGFKKNTLNL